MYDVTTHLSLFTSWRQISGQAASENCNNTGHHHTTYNRNEMCYESYPPHYNIDNVTWPPITTYTRWSTLECNETFHQALPTSSVNVMGGPPIVNTYTLLQWES